jgi:adenylosuccinate lyase
MAAIWSEEAQYRTWLDIEVLACEAWGTLGKIPDKDVKTIREKANFDLAKVKEIEKETKHDLAAFVSDVQRHIGEAGRFLHMGLTSSDVVDTAFSYRLKKSSGIIVDELKNCLKITKDKALQYKDTPMVGRTHGIHAEPISFGTKWLYWHDLLKRSLHRLELATVEISVGKISGAVGNYAHLPPEIEKHVCLKLGLKPDSFSTQVISRDRYASYFSALGLLGSCVETIVTELRHLQRTEVGEVREGFTAGQKGSSAMPHKRNPISGENLTGLARLLRSFVIPAMEDCALWHERDISHSSVERVIGPDANILADYMLSRLGSLLSALEVFPEAMQKNLNLLQGTIYSQRVLLGLIDGGMSRDEAYQIVQKYSLLALDKGTPLKQLLAEDAKVLKTLPKSTLDMLFEPRHYFQHLTYLYEKVLGSP